MEQVAGWIQAALNFVNEPWVKGAMFAVFGFAWKSHTETITRAIPFLTTVASSALGVSQLIMAVVAAANAAGGGGPISLAGVQADFIALVAAEAGKPSPWWLVGDFFVGTIIPVWASIGAHSWRKNWAQWAQEGYGLVRRGPADVRP